MNESSDDESASDESSCDAGEVSSAHGIAGSASESDSGDEDEEEKAEDSSDADDDDNMSDEESVTSVPHACFKHCDAPSDEVELESALQDKDESSQTALPSGNEPSALLSNITELEAKTPVENALTHAKRVLSSSALVGPASMATSLPTLLSPKRIRRVSEADERSSDEDMIPSEFSLGPVADMQGTSAGFCLKTYEVNPLVSTSDEDEDEQDRQLSEELEQDVTEQERESTPIPFLTPPASPLRVESEEGTTTACEWPSNLTVDSAWTAAIDLRPPSPKSLQTWEQEEEERIMESTGCNHSPTPYDVGSLTTGLTPMLKGISVQKEEAPYLRL